MEYVGFDHIVLSCHDVDRMVAFYRDILKMRVDQERPGKWAIWFANNKISLQNEAKKPGLAVHTTPGSGNFCILIKADVAQVAADLKAAGVDILEDGHKDGAQGPIDSIYFRDPEGNLVEMANQL